MRSPINRTSEDLTRALNTIARLARSRTREAQTQASETIAQSIQNILPEADISLSQSTQNKTIEVTDDNLLSRELGSLSQEADRPIARALEDAATR